MTTDLSTGKVALHRLSLYNPSRLKDVEIVAAFAARRPLFERLIADISAEKPKSRAQHHLIVGQRGMGKTLLLARIAAELRSAPLKERFIPLVFAEEQYAVDRLSKFWLNCLDSLADEQDRDNAQEAVEQIDDIVQQLSNRRAGTAGDEALSREALDAFLKAAAATGRRPVLLVDNLQLVFERLSEEEQHSLRELLMRPDSPLLVGASPSPPPESQNYGAAFYDHFKVHYLRPLSEEEMQSVLLHLSDAADRADVRRHVLSHPKRLAVLRQLSGGNPRTTVTLFFLYAEDFSPNVFSDLENLLDRVTPLYKARFEELSDQQQVIASAIANHWDPITSRLLSETTGLAPGQISSQLDRLEKIGFIERVALHDTTVAGYQIAERFFNIWFLMRSASRRQRRQVEFLTRFLQSFYEAPDRVRLARSLMGKSDFTSDSYLFACAAADAQDDHLVGEELRRHAQLVVLRQKDREARRQLEEILDLSTLPPATLQFDELRQKLAALVPQKAEVTPQEFVEQILGDRQMFRDGERERLAARSGKLSIEEINKTLDVVKVSHDIDATEYSVEAVMWISNRLVQGQLRSAHDIEDWNRAFQKAETSEIAQLMVDTLPFGFGSQLSNETIGCIRELLKPTQKSSARSWTLWGYNLHVPLGRYEEAEAAYRKAIERDPKATLAWDGLGLLFSEYLSRYEEAETAFRRAIEINSEDAFAWNGLGNVLFNSLDSYEEAEAAYRRSIELDPESGLAWNNLGSLLSSIRRSEEAEAAYRKATEIDPKADFAWNNLGLLFSEYLSRYEEAEIAFRRAIEIDPQYFYAWINLGYVLFDNLHRYEEAEVAYQRAIEIDPVDEATLQNLLFLKRDYLGDPIAACALLDRIAALPELELLDTLLLQKALFSAYRVNWESAKELLSEALNIVKDGFPTETIDDWMRASAVLLHLNYGEELLAFLEKRGDDVRLRPWYEALRALQQGDRHYLENVAPEIRTTAEKFYDEIETRLNHLPESTRCRPLPDAPKRAKRGKKR